MSQKDQAWMGRRDKNVKGMASPEIQVEFRKTAIAEGIENGETV